MNIIDNGSGSITLLNTDGHDLSALYNLVEDKGLTLTSNKNGDIVIAVIEEIYNDINSVIELFDEVTVTHKIDGSTYEYNTVTRTSEDNKVVRVTYLEGDIVSISVHDAEGDNSYSEIGVSMYTGMSIEDIIVNNNVKRWSFVERLKFLITGK